MYGKPENITKILSLATAADWAEGHRWYADAKKQINELAGEFGLPRETVAGVVAALSPMCRWSRNISDARRVLTAWAAGDDPRTVKVGTFHNNRARAFEILASGDPDLLSGDKVRSFYRNLIGDLSCATIDRHAFNAWVGDREIINQGGPRITAARYRAAAADYAAVAESAGLAPAQLQAIVWLAWRRLHVPSEYLA